MDSDDRGCDLWVTGLGVLVHLGDFGTMQGHEVLGSEVQPHSPRGQLGLPGRVKAGVRGTIIAEGFYFNQGSCRRLPAPWSGVWMKEWGFGHGCSGQRAGEGVRVDVGKNIFGVLVSYEDLCLFQLCEQEGAPCQWLSPNDCQHGKALGSGGVNMDRVSQTEAYGNQVIRVIVTAVVMTQVICQYHIFTLHIVQVAAIGSKAFEQVLDACGSQLCLSFHYLGNCCMVYHSIELTVADNTFP